MTEATDEAGTLAMGAEIMARADALAAISEDAGALTRRYLTPEHRRAVDLVGDWMKAAGMTVHFDAVGNVIGRYEGDAPDLPALVMGSHLDTVVDAGKYDGMLGVVTPISCIADLNSRARRLHFALEVIGFADEEGVRFQSTLLGSRAVAGTFDHSLLDRPDSDGTTLAEAMTGFGLDPARIGEAAHDRDQVLAYVELHIEQGPVLEAEGVAVGEVTAIAGATRQIVTITGMAGHAGTVPMAMRQDALAAAAEAVLAVEDVCRGEPGLVGTVGRLEPAPGAINVIPGLATFSLDIRAGEDAVRAAAVSEVRRRMEAACARRGVEIAIETVHDAGSATAAPWLARQIGAAITAEGVELIRLPSGAGHDAAAMTELTDMAMIFVRCPAGISHNPAESITLADADAGARVLLRVIENFRTEL